MKNVVIALLIFSCIFAFRFYQNSVREQEERAARRRTEEAARVALTRIKDDLESGALANESTQETEKRLDKFIGDVSKDGPPELKKLMAVVQELMKEVMAMEDRYDKATAFDDDFFNLERNLKPGVAAKGVKALSAAKSINLERSTFWKAFPSTLTTRLEATMDKTKPKEQSMISGMVNNMSEQQQLMLQCTAADDKAWSNWIEILTVLERSPAAIKLLPDGTVNAQAGGESKRVADLLEKDKRVREEQEVATKKLTTLISSRLEQATKK